ncbi:DNA-binding protein [Roseateles sp. UC29_93]|uniref:DNA-binding protein n=1 Tax=Roseateles sp. UC29_93 TaxID=3350177 RepID=UPI00366C454B
MSKADVQRARLGLVKAGKHPSIDAIRIELGNTGSKATIYRHLKEIEADEGGLSTPNASISEELQAFVANLASRLEYESRARIDTLQAGHAAQIKRAAEALERSQADARVARLDAERLAAELAGERTRRHEVEADMTAAKLALGQQTAHLSAQLDGVQEQLKAAQAHAVSLKKSTTIPGRRWSISATRRASSATERRASTSSRSSICRGNYAARPTRWAQSTGNCVAPCKRRRTPWLS